MQQQTNTIKRKRGRPRKNPISHSISDNESSAGESEERLVDCDESDLAIWSDTEDLQENDFLTRNGTAKKPMTAPVAFKTFTLPKRHPERQVALILDVARATKNHDSFRLLRLYPQLRTFALTLSEKTHLIDSGIVHPTMRSRRVVVTTAAEAYRVLGDRIFKSPEYQHQHHQHHLVDFADQDILNQQVNLDDQVQLPNLKTPQDVELSGGDWMYQCAVSTLQHNALLRRQRDERLYGQHQIPKRRQIVKVVRKSLAEDSDEEEDFDDEDSEEEEEEEEDSDLEEEEEESSTLDSSQKQQQQQVVKQNGFYDVHSNVTQIPALKNLGYVKIETLSDPTTIKQLTSNQTTQNLILSHKNCLDIPSIIENQKHLISSPSEVTKVVKDISYWLGGKKYEKPDASKYPVAILPRQYQAQFPM